MTPLSRRVYALSAIVLAAIIFVAINIAADAGLTTAKLDLTQNGQFTLAQGTRNIVANLKEPVTLKFFYSKDAAADDAQTAAYAKRVRDLLGQYQSISHGKIVLEEINPEPFSEAEDRATALGLSGQPTDDGDQIFFGLAGTNRVDGVEAIPFFTFEREQYLEYDITSLIYRLSNTKKPVIGILSSLQLQAGIGGLQAMMQGNAKPYVIYQEITQIFAPKPVPPDFKAIPTDMDVMLIVHPPELGEAQLMALDQFVLSGGRVLLFVDPVSELAKQAGGNPYQPTAMPPSSDVPQLLRAWGVGYSPEKIVGDKALAVRMPSRDPSQQAVSYPVWLHLTADNFDPKDPITANLSQLYMGSVGALHPLKGATTNFAPLISSSDQAALLDASVMSGEMQPQDLMDMIMPTGEKFAIAARISGPAKTAFPATAKVKSGDINVVVVADADLFDNRFWVQVQPVLGKNIAQPFAENGAFVLDAIENMTGSSDLINLRTRTAAVRPFTRVRKLQLAAQDQFQKQAEDLEKKKTEVLQHLRELQQAGAGSATLSPAQQGEVDSYRHQLIETYAELRSVQHGLRKDIDALGDMLKFINIVLVPLAVGLFAVGLWWWRGRRRARALAL
jgi:gliding motility-associatede transport system auxiliary component